MAKNIKCTQCKYYEYSGVFSPEGPNELHYNCEADESTELNRDNVRRLRDCSLFRSRTKTAWKEVGEDIWRKIPNIVKIITNFFKGK